MRAKLDLEDLNGLQREIDDPITNAKTTIRFELRRDNTLWLTVTNWLPGLFPTYEQRPLSREEADHLLTGFELYKAGGGRAGPGEPVTRILDDTAQRSLK